MSGYNAIMIARSEHQEMIRSIPSVSEYGQVLRDNQPGRIESTIGHLRQALGNRLLSMGTWLKDGRDGLRDAPNVGQDDAGIILGNP